MFELLATKTGARTNKSHACKYGFSCSVTSIYRVFLVYSTLSCPNKSISKNKGRKKLFLNYLVHFHCVQSISESFLMSTWSSNHRTFYHESNGTVFKIKCWLRKKSKSFSHKELLHLSINMSVKHCTPKISTILKNDNFLGFKTTELC